jgi:hypothetical protein
MNAKLIKDYIVEISQLERLATEIKEVEIRKAMIERSIVKDSLLVAQLKGAGIRIEPNKVASLDENGEIKLLHFEEPPYFWLLQDNVEIKEAENG